MLLWAAKEAVTVPQADNANASLGFRSITVQKSAAFQAKHFDPLKSPYCGTQKHNKVKRRCNRFPLKCCLGLTFLIFSLMFSFCVCWELLCWEFLVIVPFWVGSYFFLTLWISDSDWKKIDRFLFLSYIFNINVFIVCYSSMTLFPTCACLSILCLKFLDSLETHYSFWSIIEANRHWITRNNSLITLFFV